MSNPEDVVQFLYVSTKPDTISDLQTLVPQRYGIGDLGPLSSITYPIVFRENGDWSQYVDQYDGYGGPGYPSWPGVAIIDQEGKFYRVRAYPSGNYNLSEQVDWIIGQINGLLSGRKPVDVTLALDRSGSMSSSPPLGSGESKIAILKDAVGLFMDVWEANLLPNDRIGVTDFASDVTQYSHTEGTTTTKLVPLETHATEVGSYVDSLSTGGFTCIGGATAVSLDELAAGTLRHIVLFSDGMQNYNPVISNDAYSKDLIIRSVSPSDVDNYPLVDNVYGESAVPPKPGQSLQGFDTRIHTIGVGLSGDPWSTLMSKIASQTDGTYFETPEPEADLQNFYLNVLLELFKGASPQLVQHSSGVYDPNGDTVENSCCINSSAQWLTVALTWQGDPEDNRLVCNLQAPDGTL
ncbi:MAG: VWA domain-containing protein, partial [Deltaproteobacteria bacterium]|nr:VWA domain-containing protein [Deltaproteobacteria bacterium]